MSKMTVECTSVIILIHQLADFSQIATELFGSHRSIVPAFPLRRCAGSKGGRARPGLAYLPHLAGFALRVQPDGRRSADISETIEELHGTMACRVRISTAAFHQQRPAALGKE